MEVKNEEKEYRIFVRCFCGFWHHHDQVLELQRNANAFKFCINCGLNENTIGLQYILCCGELLSDVQLSKLADYLIISPK